MASSGGLKSSTAREWRGKYPNYPSLKLARIMYKENNLLFKNIEDARSSLRYIEGKTGARLKKQVSTTEFIKDEARPYNPYKLPNSDERDFSPFVLKGYKNIGIMSDIHIPYHSVLAVTSAIRYLKDAKIDALILNGDIIDCHKLSRFTTNPKDRNFAYELDTFKDFFSILKKELKCKIFFKIGNHEERYERFLFEKAGELSGINEFSFENILKARASDIEIIGDKRIIQMNDFSLFHGHEYIGGGHSPAYVAKTLYQKSGVSSAQAHNHRISEYRKPIINKSPIRSYSVGCLCDLHPAYMPHNEWQHGVARIELNDNGRDFIFYNKEIDKDGKVL